MFIDKGRVISQEVNEISLLQNYTIMLEDSECRDSTREIICNPRTLLFNQSCKVYDSMGTTTVFYVKNCI